MTPPPSQLDLEVTRGIGEIISDAALTLSRHVKTSLVVMLPFCALELIAREGGSTLASSARAGSTALEGGDFSADLLIDLGLKFGGAIGLYVVSLLVIVTLMAVATLQAEAVMKGEPRPSGELLRAGLRLAPRMIAAEAIFVLTLVALSVLPLSMGTVGVFLVEASWLQVVIGVVTGLIWLALVLTVYLRWVLFPQAIVLEGRGPIEALIRSAELMGPTGVRLLRGPKFRLSVLFFIYFCVASVVQSTFILPLGIVGFMNGIPLEEMPPPLAFVPLWVGIPVAAVQVLANSVLYPLKAYLPTLFYFDLQARYGERSVVDPPTS